MGGGRVEREVKWNQSKNKKSKPSGANWNAGGAAKKGPASVLSRVNNANSGQHMVKTVRIDPDADNSVAIIKLEEAQYASICVSVLANPQLYMVPGIFDLSVFWSGQKSVIPVHYFLWKAEVGCAKVASANVETVFSGAGRLSVKSHCLGPQLLSDYAFLHYNYKYDWLRPTLEEIVDSTQNSTVKSRVSRTLRGKIQGGLAQCYLLH